MQRREAMVGYLFIVPWLLGFLLFIFGPFLVSLYLSFTTYSILQPGKWIGLENYLRAFSGDDRLFWKSLGNTAYYVLFSVPLRIVLGFLLALLLNAKVRALTVWRTIFYVPSVVPIVATSIIWIYLLNPRFGLINYALSLIGLEGLPWLTSPVWSKPALVLMSTTWVGVTMLIFLAGLQGIPQHLYEAADLDGAGRWRQLWHITIPLITPTLYFNIIINLINGFQVFTQVLIMTSGSGGPLNSTRVYMLHLFNFAFRDFQMGYASALAWILFIIVLILTFLMVRTSDRWVFYEG
jgi:multiple sugar transport system permease protein